MSKKSSLFRLIAISGILIIAGIVMMFIFIRGEKEKITDGKPVTCTITSVSGTKKARSVYGFYTDDDGNKIEAEIINTVMPSVRDVKEGFIVPDKPGKVFLKTPVWLTCALMGVSLLFVMGGIAIMALGLRTRADEKLMTEEGAFSGGRIVGIRRDGAGNTSFWIAKVVYTDAEGNEHTFEDYSDANRYRHVGDTVNVNYARRKNGRYVNRIV